MSFQPFSVPPKNSSVKRDFGFNNTQNTTTLTLPRVHVSSFAVRPEGSMVYDVDTNTIYYSDGLIWIPISAASGKLLDTITVYANAENGNDANDGLTPSSAVKTIQKGLDILGTFYTRESILQLQGNTNFDLGADATLDFISTSTFSGKIIIRGEKSNVIADNVSGISDIGPFNSWKRITGVLGGYTPSVYSTKFIHNTNNDGIFVVKDNTINTIDTIAGDNLEYDRVSFQPNVAWTVGDSYELFATFHTLSYTGRCVLKNIYRPVIFEYLNISPQTDGDIWVNPLAPYVMFRGCFLGARATGDNGSYSGSMDLAGCFSENLILPTYLSEFAQNACVRTWSFWSNGPGMSYGDGCSAVFLYVTNSSKVSVFAKSSDFFCYATEIDNANVNQAINIREGSMYRLKSIKISGSASNLFQTGDGSIGIVWSLEINQNNPAPNPFGGCMQIGFGGIMYIRSGLILTTTGLGILCSSGCYLSFFSGTFSLIGTNPTSTSRLIYMLNGSRLDITANNFICTHLSPTGTTIDIRHNSSLSVRSNNITITGTTSNNLISTFYNSTFSVINDSDFGPTATNTISNSGSGRVIFASISSNINFDIRGPTINIRSTGGGNVIGCSNGSKFTMVSTIPMDFSTTNTSIVLNSASTGNTNRVITNTGGGGVLSCGSLGVAAGTTNNDIGVGGAFQQCIWYSA